MITSVVYRIGEMTKLSRIGFLPLETSQTLTVSSSSGESNVAYLQITAAKEQSIDPEQLKKMNAIFMADGNRERPFYIAVCPDPEACKALILKKRTDVLEASKLCPLFVGYSPYASDPRYKDTLRL